jgi:hypothetical protein
MKNVIITLVCCFSFTTHSRVIYSDYKKKNSVETIYYKTIEISKDNCPHKTCLARKIINGSESELLKKVYVGPGGINPTSSLCRVVKGTATSYYLKNRDAISVCRFTDGSFLMSWDFFKYLKSK